MDINKDIFPKRLKQVMEENNQTTYTIAELLHLTPATISRYINGQMSPKITAIEALAIHFNINPAWLMGYNVQKESLTSDSKYFVDYYRKEQNVKKYITETYGKNAVELLQDYSELNDTGKFEANKRVRELTYVDDYLLSPIKDKDIDFEIIDMAAHDDYNAITEDPFNAIDDIKGILKKAEQQRKNKGK